MPNIKKENKTRWELFVDSIVGEYALVFIIGGALLSAIISLASAVLLYISDVLLPFTHPFLEHKLYYYFPINITNASPFVVFVLGGAGVGLLYHLEKNIFIRRMPCPTKALCFALIPTISTYLLEFTAYLTLNISTLKTTSANDLPWLLLIYSILSLIFIPVCDCVRRRIFKMP